MAIESRYNERRDCLDQSWTRFLLAAGLLMVPLPNQPDAALALCETVPIAGLVLTGRNDLASYGGDAPERDATERDLLTFAKRNELPVLGVCRGMQMIQDCHGIALSRVTGHVTPHQTILLDGRRVDVNSYHTYGTRETLPPLETWGIADDGVIKAIRQPDGRVTGIMWHLERRHPFAAEDIALVRRLFGTA